MTRGEPDGPRPPDTATGLHAALASVEAALATGQGKRALRAAEKGLARFPESAELHHAKGLALAASGRAADAVEALAEAWTLDASLTDAYLDAAEVLMEDLADDVRALDVLRLAKAGASDDAARGEIALLRGVALSRLEDFGGALRALDESAQLLPAGPEPLAERASVLIELGRLEEGEAALRSALELSEASGRAHQLLAFVLDYSGRRAEAAAHFRQAAELDAVLPPEPPRLSEAEFDRAVEAALRAVPASFRTHLENVEIGVENYPSAEFCRRHDCSPTTLGLFVGTPLTLRERGADGLPDRIVLFQRSLENNCADRATLVREIAVTLKHEIGHLLGFSEEELVERGYE